MIVEESSSFYKIRLTWGKNNSITPLVHLYGRLLIIAHLAQDAMHHSSLLVLEFRDFSANPSKRLVIFHLFGFQCMRLIKIIQTYRDAVISFFESVSQLNFFYHFCVLFSFGLNVSGYRIHGSY